MSYIANPLSVSHDNTLSGDGTEDDPLSVVGGPSGASAFIDLTDVPTSYSGEAGKFPKVNLTEDGLEFAAIPGGGDMLASTYDPTGVNADAFDYSNFSNTPTIPTALADLSDDATHRLVTDTEKSTWNGKQDALGFTPEDVANKSTNVTTDGASDTKYPSVKAVKTYADTKLTALTPVSTQTTNYTANANEIVPCNISAGSFAVTLPSAPADKTRVRVQILTIGADKVLEVKTGGTDKFFATAGPTSLYMQLYGETQEFQYQATGGFWNGISTAPTSNFANNFPGVDATTPITNSEITLNTSTRVLTITPTLGYFNIIIDGGGKVTKFRKTGTINFPAFTDTSGMWYFYFNSAGTAVTTQTPWTVADFPSIVAVYRLLWNKELFKFTVTAATATKGDTYTNNSSTFTVQQSISGGTTLICKRTTGTNNPSASGNLVRQTGAGTNPIVFSAFSESVKSVAEYIEYHINDIPADTHQWCHLQGAQWMSGLNQSSAPLTSGTPATDGSNTVISLATGSNVDDNLEYTVTNSAAGTPWTQDMGTTTSPNNTNGGQFQIYSQDTNGLVYFLPASRFPFAFNASTNYAEYISSVGVQTAITHTNFFVCFLYSTQNPRTGEAVKIVMYPGQFTSQTLASAINWVDIQSTYNILNEGEIRPLYRLIYEFRTTYNAGNKFSALRAVQDLRKAAITSSSTATGSIPASSVTVVPSGSLSTNAQTSLEILDAGKVPLTPVAVTTARMTEQANGFTLAGGTTSKTLTVALDANVSGTNTGDQSSIVGITGTLAQFNTAITDADIMPTSGGTFSGTVVLGENSLQLDPAISADGKWSGITETGTAGGTLTFGQLCYYNSSNKWVLANASSETTSKGKLGIIVLAAAADNSATEVLLYGKVNAAAQFPNLTVGSPVYISGTSAGAVVTSAPTTTDYVTRVIGFGNTNDELFFCPSNDYYTHT